jgi:serine/threonine protein phosphatase PrpC
MIANRIGVICDPDIQVFEIKEEDAAIVIASDGVWDVLNY